MGTGKTRGKGTQIQLDLNLDPAKVAAAITAKLRSGTEAEIAASPVLTLAKAVASLSIAFNVSESVQEGKTLLLDSMNRSLEVSKAAIDETTPMSKAMGEALRYAAEETCALSAATLTDTLAIGMVTLAPEELKRVREVMEKPETMEYINNGGYKFVVGLTMETYDWVGKVMEKVAENMRQPATKSPPKASGTISPR